jgi:hypothetical protein
MRFKDPTIWPFFAEERKCGSSRHGFESLLPGKKHPQLPEISKKNYVQFVVLFARLSVQRES